MISRLFIVPTCRGMRIVTMNLPRVAALAPLSSAGGEETDDQPGHTIV